MSEDAAMLGKDISSKDIPSKDISKLENPLAGNNGTGNPIDDVTESIDEWKRWFVENLELFLIMN